MDPVIGMVVTVDPLRVTNFCVVYDNSIVAERFRRPLNYWMVLVGRCGFSAIEVEGSGADLATFADLIIRVFVRVRSHSDLRVSV